jgi:HEAT repeat protein
LNEVQNQLSAESVAAVKESALRALGSITDDSSGLLEALSGTDTHLLRGALIGLLKYGDEPAARRKLNTLLDSSSNEERNLGIDVLGEVNRPEFYPQLITACDEPRTSRAAAFALASIGADILPEIESAFCRPDAPSGRLLTLAKALGRIGGVNSQDILLSRISTPDSELRSQIINSLSQSGYRTKDLTAIRSAVRSEVEQAAWVSAAQVDLGSLNEAALLIAALQQSLVQARNRGLLLLSFVFDGNSIRHVREALSIGSPAQVSYALEIMDTQLPSDWKGWVMPLLEELSPQARSQSFAVHFPQAERRQNPADRLRAIIADERFPFWVHACAAYTSACLGLAVRKGDAAMLSTVEKVLVLKTVSMFSQTPDHVLADVADLLEEVDVTENETIFKQGDPGDSLYVILDGKVRVHDGERLLNYLGERDVFGEMALLDPEPRLASVTAIEATRLFRLDQAPFYELMAERPEVATGVIRVLSGHLRNRVRDIAGLNARIKELESGVRDGGAAS